MHSTPHKERMVGLCLDNIIAVLNFLVNFGVFGGFGKSKTSKMAYPRWLPFGNHDVILTS